MKLWLDTEFNGYKGQLISMALVSNQDHIFYEVIPCINPIDWVAKNVIPVMGNVTCINQLELTLKLKKFLDQFNEIEIIADWPDDIAYFCQSLITGPGQSIQTPTISLTINYRLNSSASAIPHNALEDAISLMNGDK